MTTFTKERAEIKSFITGFLSDPAHDNQSSDSLLANVFRIALASLEAEPVAVNDDMAYAFHHALSDSSPGADEVEEIKAGLRAAFANVTAQPEPVVPDEIELAIENLKQKLVECNRYNYCADAVKNVEDACHAAMLQSQREGNPHVTPARLPGGFTIEDAKELHEDLVRSHISQALSGEKMKKKDRDADLRWIHGVIVQAAWFVKASLEQNALTGDSPGTPAGWISCSERMPEIRQTVIGWNGYAVRQCVYTRNEYAKTQKGREPRFETLTGIWHGVTHWMPLPEPPQEVNRG